LKVPNRHAPNVNYCMPHTVTDINHHREKFNCDKCGARNTEGRFRDNPRKTGRTPHTHRTQTFLGDPDEPPGTPPKK